LGKSNTWSYRVTGASGESRYTIKSLGVEKGRNIVALLEYSDIKNNLIIKDSVICQDGAIVNYPLFVLNMLFSDYLDHYIDTVHITTDYAPKLSISCPEQLGNELAASVFNGKRGLSS